jgi:hypothetical protein
LFASDDALYLWNLESMGGLFGDYGALAKNVGDRTKPDVSIFAIPSGATQKDIDYTYNGQMKDPRFGLLLFKSLCSVSYDLQTGQFNFGIWTNTMDKQVTDFGCAGSNKVNGAAVADPGQAENIFHTMLNSDIMMDPWYMSNHALGLIPQLFDVTPQVVATGLSGMIMRPNDTTNRPAPDNGYTRIQPVFNLQFCDGPNDPACK